MRIINSAVTNPDGKKRLAAAAVSFLLLLIAVIAAGGGTDLITGKADTEYTVSGLDMRIAVSNDHIMEAEVFISVDIPAALRRIEFAIPGASFRPEALTVEGEKAKTVRRKSGIYVAVKDPELLTAGHHRYRITYRLRGKTDNNSGGDVFRFDVVPAAWNIPAEKLHALLWFPYGFPVGDIRPYAEGSQDVKLRIKTEPQSRSYTIGAGRIPGSFTLRLEADLPEGYWN